MSTANATNRADRRWPVPAAVKDALQPGATISEYTQARVYDYIYTLYSVIDSLWVERGTAVTDAQSQAQTIDELSAMIQRQEIRIKVIEERIAQPQKFYLKGHTEPC